jgi:glycosyltransferase involved in cell wall biosynthesis
MDSRAARRTGSGDGPTCAFVAFEPLRDSAHTVHLLTMWDALTTSGVDTELLMYPPEGAAAPDAGELRRRYGLDNTPLISWVPYDGNRGTRVLRVLVESFRASRRRTYAYTTSALPALGALLGGARDVFLEFHAPVTTRSNRAAFGLVRHSPRLRMVCVSQRLAGMLADRYGIEVSRFIVEHNGTSFPIHDDYRADGADGRRLRAMYVGTFAPGRGLETILALAELHPAVDFVVAGGDAPARGLPGNVSVPPRLTHAEVPGLLAQADILLMPYTRDEGLPDGIGGAEFCSPLKMIEYLSAGRSIIASDLPSIAEVLVDGSNCLLVEPDSVPGWSAAMRRLEDDAGLRVRLAHGAAATAGQHTILGRVGRILAHASARS